MEFALRHIPTQILRSDQTNQHGKLERKGNRRTFSHQHIVDWIQKGMPKGKGFRKFADISRQGNALFARDGRQVVPRELTATVLKTLYFNPSTGFLGKDKLYDAAQSRYVGITRKSVQDFLNRNSTHQQTHALQKNVVVKPLRPKRPHSTLQIDLVDMSIYSDWNRGNKWILMCVDVFTKKAYARAMPNKRAATTRDAFITILDSLVEQPSVVQSDNGSEFMGEFRKMLHSRHIKQIFSTSHAPQSQGQVERTNRTIKAMMERYFVANDTKRWFDVLEDITQSYNSTVHSRTRHRPTEVALDQSDVNDVKQRIANKADQMMNRVQFRPLAIGDWVRISLQRFAKVRAQQYRKSFKRNWTRELYRVVKTVRGSKSSSVTHDMYYRLVQENGKPFEKLVHRKDLLLSVAPDRQIAHGTEQKRNVEELSEDEDEEKPNAKAHKDFEKVDVSDNELEEEAREKHNLRIDAREEEAKREPVARRLRNSRKAVEARETAREQEDEKRFEVKRDQQPERKQSQPNRKQQSPPKRKPQHKPKPPPPTYIVEDIVGRKKENGRLYYAVKWEGYDSSENTWEPATELRKKKAIAKLIREFDQHTTTTVDCTEA